MKTLVLIPTYNEKDNIKNLVKEIFSILSCDCSVLVIDDNSPDKTIEAVVSMQKDYSGLFFLQRNEKKGLASAYLDGFTWGIKNGFEYFITMDADFSHNPKYLPVFIENLEKYDVVIGSRNIKNGKVKGWSFLRNLISKGGSIYSRLVLGMFRNTIFDLTGGYNAYSLNAIKKIDISTVVSKGYLFQIEMKYKAWKNRCSCLEFPIIFEDRKYGQSKMCSKIFFEALINIWKIRL